MIFFILCGNKFPLIRWCMIETSLGLPRKSSAVFGNFRAYSEVPENVRQCSYGLRTIFENFRKSSKSGRKSSENLQNRRHQDVYVIKRTLHASTGYSEFDEPSVISWQDFARECLFW